MAQKKKTVGGPAAEVGSHKAKRRAAAKPAGVKPRKQATRRNPQPRVWRRVAKLADDGLSALEAGDMAEVRRYLEAIRAVGLSAQES